MIRVIRADVADRPLDGSVFAYLGFRFSDEIVAGGFPGSMTGLLLMPTELPDSIIKGAHHPVAAIAQCNLAGL